MTPPIRMVSVPPRGPGHCDDDGAWAEFVRQYDGQPRSLPDMTDFALANAVFMVGRDDLNLMRYQTAAKERIRWLSIELAKAQAMLTAAPVREEAPAWRDIASAPVGVEVWGFRPAPEGIAALYGVVELVQFEDGEWFGADGDQVTAPTLWAHTNKPPHPITGHFAREEAPAEAEGDDDDASTYRPSMAGLSDYLWNQAIAAESVESRCILEMWREAVGAQPQAREGAPEPMNWVSRVMEVREEGDGFWQACSGCQESVDGHVSTTDYPYSAAFGCQPGGGCSECGGLGVKWDTTDYDAMASYILATEKQSDILNEIGDERYRQVEVEDFKTERDDAYTGGELAKAAAAYKLSACGFQPDAAREMWPSAWSSSWWKPTDARRDLIKAGALIVAEIERRDRAAPHASEGATA